MLIKSFFYSFISYKIPYHLTSIHLLCESVMIFHNADMSFPTWTTRFNKVRGNAVYRK